MCFFYEFQPFPNHFAPEKSKLGFFALFSVSFFCLQCATLHFFDYLLSSSKFCLHYEVFQVYLTLYFEITFDFRFLHQICLVNLFVNAIEF